MKRPLKIALGVLAAVVVLLVVGVAVFLARLDGLVKQTVEREGTAQLDLATTLADADVSVFGGSLTLDGLTVANPPGYSAPNLFELGQVNVGVGYRDLTGDPVRIDSIDINSPSLVIERSGEGSLADQLRSNLQDLLDRLDSGDTTTAEGEATKLLIGRLTVTGARVAIRPNLPELDEEYALTLPDVTLNGIGTADEAENGAEIGRVTADVAMALARKALESEDLPPEVRAVLAGDFDAILSKYGDKLKDEVRDRLRDELGDVGEQLGEDAAGAIDAAVGGDVEGAAEKARESLEGEARDRIGKGLGGLLDRGAKDDQ